MSKTEMIVDYPFNSEDSIDAVAVEFVPVYVAAHSTADDASSPCPVDGHITKMRVSTDGAPTGTARIFTLKVGGVTVTTVTVAADAGAHSIATSADVNFAVDAGDGFEVESDGGGSGTTQNMCMIAVERR